MKNETIGHSFFIGFKRPRAFITILFAISLLLSGCFSQKGYNIDGDALNPEQIEESDDTTPEEIPLEAVESKKELQEELDALSKSGDWAIKKDNNTKQQDNSIVYDFPVIDTHQVNTYIKLFQGRLHKTFAKHLERSGRYLPMLEAELAARNLPKDLAYLAMVESGFNPLAKSPANAVGLWQFIDSTGKSYNLRINKYIDERRNVEKATKAAANFLGDLYRDFGDWYLAVAAYNAGPGKIRKGLERYKVDSFWQLAEKDYLAMETKRYVPKLIATILIARNPKAYGFGDVKTSKPVEYDELPVGPAMSLDAVAMITGYSSKEIRRLNPELRRQMTPAGDAKYKVRIPQGTLQLAQSNFRRLHRVATTAYKIHKVQRKDTLLKICKRYDINATTLLKVNHLKNGRLHKGKRLRIPYSTVAYKLLPKGTSAERLASSKNDLILHKVKKGDTLSRIARHYNVDERLIASWNGLKNKKKIKRGQQLALFMNEAKSGYKRSLEKDVPVQIFAHNQKTLLNNNRASSKAGKKGVIQIAATNKKVMLSEIANSVNKKQIARATKESKSDITQYYNVRRGDSLWKIAQKFQISTANIKEWNDLKNNNLRPGKTLKIKTR